MNIHSIYPATVPVRKQQNLNTAGFGESFSDTAARVQKNEMKIFMKTDDMLYSGGNGTGLSYYIKYAEGSTDNNPVVVARGIDENGNDFEQTIRVNEVDPRNATIVEMRALEACTNAPKRNGFSSLPMDITNVGLNQRQDYIAAFQKEIADMNTLGQYGIAGEYRKLLDFYDSWKPNDDAKLYGRSRVEQLVSEYGEDNSYSKALRNIEKSFDATFPGASNEVKDAWIDMCIDSGVDQITGITLDGKHAHISQIMVQKAVNDYNIEHGNYQYADSGWGKSFESIIGILRKGIHDIDNPLPGQPEQSNLVKKLVEKERAFYVEFLNKFGYGLS